MPKTSFEIASVLRVSTIILRRLTMLTILLLASCTKQDAPSSTARSPKWFRWVVASLPVVEDWRRCQTRSCEKTAHLIARGLTRLAINDGAWVVTPDLAQWKSPSASEWEFTLQEATWSDGTALTRTHVIASWQEVLKNCKKFPRADLLLPIANARYFCDGKAKFESVGIKAAGPNSIRIRLDHPVPSFPRRLSHPVAWPYRKEAPLATVGPFSIQSVGRDRIRLATSQGQNFPWDGIELLPVPSAEGRLQTFLEHSAEMVDELTDTVAAQAGGSNALRSIPTTQMVALILPPSRRPFHLAQLRQLIRASVDRREVVELMRWPHFPTHRLLAPATSPPPMAAVAKVRETLASMKSELGPWSSEHTERIPKQILFTEEASETARNLEAQWKKQLGISVEVMARPADRPLSPRSAYLITVEIDPHDPTRPLESLFSLTRSLIPSGQARTCEAWLANASLARTEDAFEEAIAGAERWLLEEEALVIPLYVRGQLILYAYPPPRPLQNPIEFWEFWNTTSS